MSPQDLSSSTAFAQLAGALGSGSGKGAIGDLFGGIAGLFGKGGAQPVQAAGGGVQLSDLQRAFNGG